MSVWFGIFALLFMLFVAACLIATVYELDAVIRWTRLIDRHNKEKREWADDMRRRGAGDMADLIAPTHILDRHKTEREELSEKTSWKTKWQKEAGK